MFNPVIVVAIIVQAIVAKFSRIVGAVLGYVITTGILLWGISLYGNGDQIALFGIPLSEPIFLLACLVWYAFDTKEFVQARKYAAFTSQLSGTSPSSGGSVASPETGQIGEGTEGNVAIVVSWKGIGVISDVDVFVTLDGAPAGSGSFVQGFVLNLTTTEGVHEIGVKASFRRSTVTLNTERNRSYRVDLQYSRMSGKFQLKSSETDGEAH